MYNFKLDFLIFILLSFHIVTSETSSKKICVDENCKVPISLARTLLRYSSPEPGGLSFNSNVEARILSKEVGSQRGYWEAEINGKRGYVPANYVREYKILSKDTITISNVLGQQHKELDQPISASKNISEQGQSNVSGESQTDLTPDKVNLSEQKQSEVSGESPNDLTPDKVKETYEVIDGTTIYPDISPSSTEAPVHSTSIVPEKKLSVHASTSEEKPNSSKDSLSNEVIPQVIQNISVNNLKSDKENEYPKDSPSAIVNDKNQETDSVVRKALSSFSQWMNHDEEETVDGEDDGEDDGEIDTDDDEEVEDEEEEEETSNPKEQSLSTEHKISSDERELETSNTVDVIGDEKENSLLGDTTTQLPISNIKNEDKTPTLQGTLSPDEKEKTLPGDTTTQLPIINMKTEVKTPTLQGILSPDEKEKTLPGDTTTQLPIINMETEVKTPTLQSTPSPSVLENVQEATKGTLEEDDIPDPSKLSTTQQPIVEIENLVKAPNLQVTPQPSEVENIQGAMEVPAPTAITPEPVKPSDAPAASTPEPLLQSTEDHLKIVNSDSQSLLGDLGAVTTASSNQEALTQEKLATAENIPEKDLSDSSPIVNFFNSAAQIDTASEGSFNSSESSVENIPGSYVQDPQGIPKDSSAPNSEINDIELSPKSSPPEISAPDFLKVDLDLVNTDNTRTEESMDDIEDATNPIATNYLGIPVGNSTEINQPAVNSEQDLANDDITELVDSDTTHVEVPEPSEPLDTDEKIKDDQIPEKYSDTVETFEEEMVEDSASLFSSIMAFFTNNNAEELSNTSENSSMLAQMHEDTLSNVPSSEEEQQEVETGYCDTEICKTTVESDSHDFYFNYDLFLYLSTSAISCIIFLFIYLAMDKNNRLKPLIAKINQLEKEMMITLKENEMLQERGHIEISENENAISSDTYDLLTQKLSAMEASKQVLEMEVINLQKAMESKQVLEQQIEMLEKELETSTEVGMELNRIISEMLDPADGSDRLKENVEQLQRQLLEQKMTIEEGNNMLQIRETEVHQLQRHLEASEEKTKDLQEKLDSMLGQISKIEADREQEQKSLQDEVAVYQQKYNEGVVKNEMLTNDIQALKAQLTDSQRQAELRIKEYNILKDSLKTIKSISNDTSVLHSLLDATSMKAEFHQLKSDNENRLAQLKQEQAAKVSYERKCQEVMEDNQALIKKYRDAEKEKVEANMKLEVLNNYFKKKEEELQGEILKYKSIWETKEGEATSTTERIKLMQEEIENYKSQNETLKQEIISQEIDLKSQISMLEKKVHENWVNARQTERKLEDARQEAAQLRNRITLRERNQNRLQSPLDQNGDLTMSTNSFDSPSSPPLLFGGRDHMTKSPPAMSVLPPFLPPPPGAPFLPPPPHGMPFMPPPPNVYPGDHRPPPLGRLSSPPPMMNARYSPDSSAFSPYDRNSPSPPYDSEYGASPPPVRRYSPYERDYQRMTHTSNGRNKKGSMMSSGSDHSVESLDKLNRKQSKMV